MRVDINLATRPYEDAGPLWLRWGGGLAALGLVTLIILYMVIAGWLAARKDRGLIALREQQIAVRDQERTRKQKPSSISQKIEAPAIVRSFSTTCSGARRSPGPKCLRIWNG